MIATPQIRGVYELKEVPAPQKVHSVIKQLEGLKVEPEKDLVIVKETMVLNMDSERRPTAHATYWVEKERASFERSELSRENLQGRGVGRSHMLDGLRSHPDRSLIDHLLGNREEGGREGRIIEWKGLGLDRDRALKMLRICALSHDFAKACADFQDRLKNEHRHVSHAPLSSLVCYHVMKNEGFDRKLSAFAHFVVKHHHGTLPNFGLQQEITERDLHTFQRQFGTIPPGFLEWFSKAVGCRVDGSILKQ